MQRAEGAEVFGWGLQAGAFLINSGVVELACDNPAMFVTPENAYCASKAVVSEGFVHLTNLPTSKKE